MTLPEPLVGWEPLTFRVDEPTPYFQQVGPMVWCNFRSCRPRLEPSLKFCQSPHPTHYPESCLPFYTVVVWLMLCHAGNDVGGRCWRARRVDLIIAPASQYYYALVGWTGSKHFNRSLRLYAQRRFGRRLTSHGLFDPATVYSCIDHFINSNNNNCYGVRACTVLPRLNLPVLHT